MMLTFSGTLTQGRIFSGCGLGGSAARTEKETEEHHKQFVRHGHVLTVQIRC